MSSLSGMARGQPYKRSKSIGVPLANMIPQAACDSCKLRFIRHVNRLCSRAARGIDLTRSQDKAEL